MKPVRPRAYFAALCVLATLPTLMIGSPNSGNTSASLTLRHKRDRLTLEQRVAYQRAIEEIYWQHRIWPKENPNPKPPLEEVMPLSQIQAKVEDYLRKSKALETYWHRPITGEQLQAEMTRMANQTRQPDVLKEIFAVLGNDPYLIAECLAKPMLAERLLRSSYASDQRFHGRLKEEAEADLATHSRIEDLQQSNGKYTQLRWLKRDAGGYSNSQNKEGSDIRLSREEWNDGLRRLERELAKAAGHPIKEPVIVRHPSQQYEEQIDPALEGMIGELQEDEERYWVRGLIRADSKYLKIAIVEWKKEGFDTWWDRVSQTLERERETAKREFTLVEIASIGVACSDNSWESTSTGANLPSGRASHTAIWTGTEMIVWGGLNVTYTNTGAKYNPSTDTWTGTSISGATPSARELHTAVWTGTEMIVWGGYDGFYTNTGGRYSPSTNAWTATNTANAPSGQAVHTAVWTGSQMIVWGGYNGFYTNTGGKYNPDTDTWTTTSTSGGVPSPRQLHTAVWTGTAMIIWGGYDGNNYYNSGARYNPNTDIWVATSFTNAPSARGSHTAVWTGTEMILWGGLDGAGFLNTGRKYNPSSDTWTSTSTSGAAPSARDVHTAVWTGSEMIVWGGFDGSYTITGGRYNPSANTWTATSISSVPSARRFHSAVWTGNQMIIWGGQNTTNVFDTGGRYIVSAYTILPTSQSVPATGGSNAVNVFAPGQCTWNAVSNDVFISVNAGSSGSGNGTVNYSIAPNTGPIRMGTMTIAGISFTVTQGSGCTFTLDRDHQSFPGDAATGTVNVMASDAACTWTANTSSTFITITSGSMGTGPGTVQYSVTANIGFSNRSNTITIAGHTFTVYQGINFTDVPSSDPFYTDIGKLSARGVTLGCGNGNYCPNDPVTREQMAALIVRAKGEFNPPTPPNQRFNDVPPSNQFYNFVDRLAALQITQGCTPDHLLFCPADPVKRDQMAAFIMRGLGEFNPPTPGSQRFNDVPPSNVFYNFIDRLAVLNVTLGCTPDHLMYCPNDSVTRAQMAAFLVRAFGL